MLLTHIVFYFLQILQARELIDPSHVADTYWQLAAQHRSAWTFECTEL
jgi:hypothetical protein